MKKSAYGMLVNTCDGFEDCWDAYFKLHAVNWPECRATIYLNTEYKDYRHSGLDIVSLKSCERRPRGRRATWSECLSAALEKIREEVVLYMQEDYFLSGPVQDDLIESFVDLMQRDQSVHCIHLTDQGPPGVLPFALDDRLEVVPRLHRDRISCQAALWRKDVLRQYLRGYESGWNFEWFGSKRASILDHNFYAVDRDWVKLGNFEIVPYVFTGVIGGRWNRDVIPLFERHGIPIDFDRRGFHAPSEKSFLGERIAAKLKRFPIAFRSGADLVWMRLSGMS